MRWGQIASRGEAIRGIAAMPLCLNAATRSLNRRETQATAAWGPVEIERRSPSLRELSPDGLHDHLGWINRFANILSAPKPIFPLNHTLGLSPVATSACAVLACWHAGRNGPPRPTHSGPRRSKAALRDT